VFLEWQNYFIKILSTGGRGFGSFDFALPLACVVGAKANVPNVGWHKIIFKNVRWGKF